MVKRILCLVIISSLLYTDIVYPLNNSSRLQDSGFRTIIALLANPSRISEVSIVKNTSGVWLDGKNWKMRFYKPEKASRPTLQEDDELVYEEKIGDKLTVQVFFKGLDDEAKGVIRGFLFNNPNVSSLARMVLKEIIGESEPPIGRMHDLYMERAREEKYWEYFLEKIPADIRLIEGSDSFEFKHGDSQDLPDFIGLNLRLFDGTISPETQVFLLRHCTDRIRYDRDKTIINDAKYLLLLSKEERERILRELPDEKYFRFLKEVLRGIKPKKKLPREVKQRIHDFTGLRFKNYTSPDGARIHYTVGGNTEAKRTLVFLHGVGVNSRDWRHQITFFEEDYKILTVDLRGFGKSESLSALSPQPHIRNYSKDVEGVLTQEDINDAILIGHSMGGMVILNMDEIYGDKPIEERRIKGIVLISTIAGKPTESFFFPWLKEIGFDRLLKILLNMLRYLEFVWDSKVFRWIVKRSVPNFLIQEIFRRFIIQRETHPLFTRKVTRSVFANNLEDLIYGFLSILKHNVSDSLKDLNIPVLWLVGKGDPIVLPREQFEDARQIKGCKVVTIQKASHYPHARYPRRANKAIYEFINSGEFRFLQLVNEIFQLDISMDELDSELKDLQRELRERLQDVKDADLRLIDDVSRVISSCGELTCVSEETMRKAVLTTRLLPKGSIQLPPTGPVGNKGLGDRLYRYIVESA